MVQQILIPEEISEVPGFTIQSCYIPAGEVGGDFFQILPVSLIGRSNGGFATCLVLRVDSRGTLTAANAGYLAPYVGGREVETENGFPLVLAGEAKYIETITELECNARLTLVTDGAVEARKGQGELMRFERTQEISMEPAELIAKTAQQFGQEDDITVLTLQNEPIAELA